MYLNEQKIRKELEDKIKTPNYFIVEVWKGMQGIMSAWSGICEREKETQTHTQFCLVGGAEFSEGLTQSLNPLQLYAYGLKISRKN